ncbi:MAG: hypothetical protein PHS74_03250 [Lachnospiraceae bacterium]|nr:hypothetical protein [Lachnospiraceae bacterium]
MKMISYWDDFCKTGSIEDYLRCKVIAKDTVTRDTFTKDENRAGQENTGTSTVTGDSSYAGFLNYNGNSNESSTYRGV